jgi:adenylyl-sulfate kinase
MEQPGFTIWFTGISGSGKSTLVNLLHDKLQGRGHPSEILDSGRIRQAINRSLGFTREEIDTNLRRLAYECRMLNRNGVIALVAAVSPYQDQRERVRKDIGRYVEVYCRCPLEVLFERGQAELFEKAKSGQIAHVAGVNAPYEEPIDPDVLVDTDKESPEQAAARILTKLETLGYIPRASSAEYTAEEEAIIKNRLKDMGYI